MKAKFKGFIIIILVGILIVATILISSQSPTSKTIILSESDLKSKVVPLAESQYSGIIKYNITALRFTGYLLEIKNPKRIKVGYSKSLGKEGEITSNIAKDNNAIAAINGIGFKDESVPFAKGIIMSKGNLIRNDSSNLKTSVMGITKNGILVVGNHNLAELKSLGVTDAISFGPCIIANGVGLISGDGGQGVSPRTAIGQKQDGTILLLVIDGRQALKVGATLEEVQDLMLKNDAVNAINLEGGSSSTMYYNGSIINKPSDTSGERPLDSIVYVTP